MLVVKLLEILALPLEQGIACEPLAAEKLFVICIVEALYYAIAPRLSNRDKYWLNAEVES